MAFLSSLIFTGTRVGGQRERQTQAFESGIGYFPRDYPFTPTYEAYATQREKEERERWERKPPAKRVNFEKLGTRSPWEADWGVILSIEKPDAPSAEFVTTQRDTDEGMAVDEPSGDSPIRPWLVQGPGVSSIVENISKSFHSGPALLAEINELRLKRSMKPLTVEADELLQGALVRVRIQMCLRGAPDDLAVIYAMDDVDVQEYLKRSSRSSFMETVNDDSVEEEVTALFGLYRFASSYIPCLLCRQDLHHIRSLVM